MLHDYLLDWINMMLGLNALLIGANTQSPAIKVAIDAVALTLPALPFFGNVAITQQIVLIKYQGDVLPINVQGGQDFRSPGWTISISDDLDYIHYKLGFLTPINSIKVIRLGIPANLSLDAFQDVIPFSQGPMPGYTLELPNPIPANFIGIIPVDTAGKIIALQPGYVNPIATFPALPLAMLT